MTTFIEPLQFARRLPGITAFCTTRGTELVPGDNYSAFNVCDYTGDSPAHVMQCRMELCQALRIAPDRLVMPRQTHTAHVAEVTSELLALPYPERMAKLQDTDALVTCLHGVCIGVNTADCVSIALVDPVAHVIAVAHAGWRGTVARIAASTVQAMQAIGAEPSRTLAVMGASICQDCFEVGDEVVEAFAQAGFEVAEITKRNPATGKAHIALQRANALVLQEAGLSERSITASCPCTRCNPTRYFSARRLGVPSGRTLTALLQS